MTNINRNLPNKEQLLRNFGRCGNIEEKYRYIVELGSYLPPLPEGMLPTKHLIHGCQSKVWLVMITDDKGMVQLYGDSDASIVKGLMATVFILYHGLTAADILGLDISFFFHKLALTQYLTPSRSHGLEAIVRKIRSLAAAALDGL